MTAKDEGDRGYIEWKPDKRTAKLRHEVLTIVQTYPEQGLPAPTPRDVYYDVVAHYGYKKDPRLQRRIYYILRKARRAKLITFDAITDDTEASAYVGGYTDPAAFYRSMQSYAAGYMRDFEDNQKIHLELFAEGKGKVQQLTRVARDYHIAVRSPGGYDRIMPKRGLALRAAREWEEYDRPTTVLHMGDFDPDGEEIFNVFVEDARAFLSAHIDDDPEDVLTFKRIAVRPEQVPQERRGTFDLSAKHEDDTRAARWPHKYELQLEALGVPRILEIAREEIEAVLDLDQIEEDKEQSRPERKKVRANMQRLAEEAADEEEGEEEEEAEEEEAEEDEEEEEEEPPSEEEESHNLPQFVIDDLRRNVVIDVNKLMDKLEHQMGRRIPYTQRAALEDEAYRRLARELDEE